MEDQSKSGTLSLLFEDADSGTIAGKHYFAYSYGGAGHREIYARHRFFQALGLTSPDESVVVQVIGESGGLTRAFAVKEGVGWAFAGVRSLDDVGKRLGDHGIKNPVEEMGNLVLASYLFGKEVASDSLRLVRHCLVVDGLYPLSKSSYDQLLSLPFISQFKKWVSPQLMERLRSYGEEQIIKDFRGVLNREDVVGFLVRRRKI